MMDHSMPAYPQAGNGNGNGNGNGHGASAHKQHNVGKTDRVLSALLGASTLIRVGRRHGMGKAAAATSGLMLLTRAVTGHSKMYEALGVSSAALGEGAGINLDVSITIMRPAEEIYEFWSEVTNLPLFMRHLESVEDLGGGVTRWKARGPGKLSVEWDAQLINEEYGEFLAWQSLPGSEIDNAGSVHFSDAGSSGTEVRVNMRYRPKGLATGFAIAKFMNPVTEAEVLADLRRLKHVMETGIDLSAEGQPSGSEGGL